MKYTLLQLTQSVLSSLSSDEVNSIGDTSESLQVAEIIRQKYFDIINRVNLPEHEQLIQLGPNIDVLKPVTMHVPDGVTNIEWLKYFDSNILDNVSSTVSHGVNTDIVPQIIWTGTSTTSNSIGVGTKTFTIQTGMTIAVNQPVSINTSPSSANTMTGVVTGYVSLTGVLTVSVTSSTGTGTFSNWIIQATNSLMVPPGYKYVNILDVKSFIEIVNSFNPAEGNVLSYTFTDDGHGYPGTYTLYYRNDRQPTYCCIINNYHILFDSYDSTQDDTLQASKTMAWGQIIPTFQMNDTFIPDLSEDQFQLLLNESKSLAFFELKQQPHPLAVQETKRGWSNIQKNKAVANRPTYFDQLPNYGRSNISGFGGAPRYFKLMGFDN